MDTDTVTDTDTHRVNMLMMFYPVLEILSS